MLKHLIITLGGSIGQFLISIISSILTARLLGSEARGELAAIQLLPTLLIAIAALGTPQALTYYTARSPRDAGDLLGSALAISTFGILITLAGGWLVTPYILNNHESDIINAGLIYLLIIPLATYYGIPWSSFLGSKDYVSFNILKLLPNITYLIAICLAFLHPNPVLIIQANIVLVLILVLPSVWVTYILRIGLLIKVRFQTIQKIATYSFISFITSLVPIINQRIEYFFILSQLDASALGIYTVAAMAGQAQLTAISSIGAVLLPNVASTEIENKTLLFSRLFRLTIIASILSTFTLIAILPEVLSLLYGKEFSDASIPASILVAASGVMGVNQILGDGFRGIGRPNLLLWSEALSLIIKLLLLSINQINLTTISIIVLIGTFVGFIINLLLFHRVIEKLSIHWFGNFFHDLLLILKIFRRNIF